MAEKIISPGVFTKEIDQTFLPAAIADIGAAIVGPTLKGPVLVPTVVNSFSEYETIFGTTITSGSKQYQYLTSHTAEEYLKSGGPATIVRVAASGYSEATASILSDGTSVGATYGSGSFSFVHNPTGSLSAGGPDEFRIGSVAFVFVSQSVGLENSSTQRFVDFGTGHSDPAHATASAVANLVTAVNAATIAGITTVSASAKGLTTNLNGVLSITGSTTGTSNNLTITTGSGADDTATTANFARSVKVDLTTERAFTMIGGTANSAAGNTIFKLHTISEGEVLNSLSGTGTTGLAQTNNLLRSGSKDNIRYEISERNLKKGTFTLLIRRGNDRSDKKQILETWNNLTLDDAEPNFISKVIGDQKQTLREDENGNPYLQLSGSTINKSKYVYVEVLKTFTSPFLDDNGEVAVSQSAAVHGFPALKSGSYGGAFGGASEGTIQHPRKFYTAIEENNSQGLDPSTDGATNGYDNYIKALNLLKNQDEYDFNLLFVPGIIDNVHGAVAKKAIQICEERGDAFAIIDPVKYGTANISSVISVAEGRDSNFAAMYWPWVQVRDTSLGVNRFVPPSVVMSGVYAFNDKVAHPWFAPAGLNRGGIDSAIQAERKLTHSDRDTLYESNVNPLATFPGQGVTAFGQKTLQKKSSALDRINVRRLLIRLKKFIASSSRYLVFEQNTAATRGRFLNIVNPFLEQVQAQSGLTAFRVVMDETNNTPDVVDRNILYGQIFVQPARTAEFIVLDFTIQPSGATFPE